MFGKEEFQELKKEFWDKLGSKLNRKKNPYGTKVPWMNYRTRINGLYFRMEADEHGARLCIDLQFKDEGVREVFFEQFEEFKSMLDSKLENLQWQNEFEHTNGLTISRISAELHDHNLKNKDHWPEMHQFLVRNFVALDAFWVEFSEVFENLK